MSCMPADIVAEIMCRYACYGFKINVWEFEKKQLIRTSKSSFSLLVSFVTGYPDGEGVVTDYRRR